ncbi:MAG: hypothetical protein Cons2KO_11450 [Congregibacter sp.]
MESDLGMEFLQPAVDWIADNETLLSGLAALTAVVGMVVSPLWVLLKRRKGRQHSQFGIESSTSTGQARKAEQIEQPEELVSDAPLLSAGERPSVLVLPFLNLSNDVDTDYLADGITEDLISGLSQSKHLSLCARSTSFSYKGMSPDVRQVGREHGAPYVVEGSIRPFGGQVRISVQLIEAKGGRQLFSKRLDLPLGKIFDAQDEITTLIAATLGAQLSSAEADRVAKLKPVDLTTWDAIQRSLRVLTYTYINKEEADVGVTRLEHAVEKNPEHVYARAALSWFLVLRVINFCSDDPQSDMDKYTHHLGIAASAMGDDPYAMMLVGNAFTFGGKYEDALDILVRAIELNPGSTDPYPGLAISKCFLRDYAGARLALERARKLSATGGFAVNFEWFETLIDCVEGEFERAMPTLRRIAVAHPTFPAIHILLALAYQQRGDDGAVRDAIASSLKASSSMSLAYLKLIPYTHPDITEHQRRIALIEPYWPAERG